jgi:hypothetical protein
MRRAARSAVVPITRSMSQWDRDAAAGRVGPAERPRSRADVAAGGRLELGVQRAFGCELASPGFDCGGMGVLRSFPMRRWCSRNSAVTTAQIVWLPRVLRAGRAAPIPVEPGYRVGATGLKLSTEHVAIGHRSKYRAGAQVVSARERPSRRCVAASKSVAGAPQLERTRGRFGHCSWLLRAKASAEYGVSRIG